MTESQPVTQSVDHSDLPEVPEASAGEGGVGTATASRDDVVEAMKDVVDPELGINVVDLGLVYDVHIDAHSNAVLDMTLDFCGLPADRRDPGPDQLGPRGPGRRRHDQLGLDAAVGSRQDHPRRSGAAARARVQRLRGSPAGPARSWHGFAEENHD